MANAINWLHNATAPKQTPAETSGPPSRSTTTYSQRLRDRNAPDTRLALNQKCIYERRLPGDSYVTAHIVRLQCGYYDSPVIHEDRINNCRYVGINFVFHPSDERHRFISANIRLSIHDENVKPDTIIPLPPQIDRRPSETTKPGKRKPKFLRFSPHLLFGMVSPETLDWNFNLAGSLGVTQGPANATITPSGGVKSSYKIFKMMKIQGSTRTLSSWFGHEYDVEDGELVWTLEENALQKSGLPREFSFVMLLTKGDSSNNIAFEIDIDPVVGSWYGTYPKWWMNRIWYQALYKEPVDLNQEFGQKFQPATKEEGFNFAAIEGSFDDFVYLPGTTYSTSDQQSQTLPANTDAAASDKAKRPQPRGGQRQITASPAPNTSNDLNIRVYLEGMGQTALAPLLPLQMIQPQHTRSLPSAQPSSLASVTASSPAKSRERPSSAVYSPSPPSSDKRSSTRQRPISAVIGQSTTPPSGPRTSGRRNIDIQRPLSTGTDISEDLYIHGNSPLSHDGITPPRPSHSLRHSRSRSGLEKEYKTPPREEPSRQVVPGQKHRRSTSHSISITSSSVRPSTSAPSAVPSLPAPPPATSFTTPRKRHSSRTDDVKRLSVVMDNSPPDDPRNTVRFATEPQHVDKYSQHNGPIQVQALNFKHNHQHSPNSTSAEQRQSPPPPAPQPPASKYSFPPTSYPMHQAVRDMANTPSGIPAAPSPPRDEVNGIIQREVINYLRTHPDLMSPVASTYSSSQTLPNGHAAGNTSGSINGSSSGGWSGNGSANRAHSGSPNQRSTTGSGGLGRSLSDGGRFLPHGGIPTRTRSLRKPEVGYENGSDKNYDHNTITNTNTTTGASNHASDLNNNHSNVNGGGGAGATSGDIHDENDNDQDEEEEEDDEEVAWEYLD